MQKNTITKPLNQNKVEKHLIYIPLYQGNLYVIDAENVSKAIKDTVDDHGLEDYDSEACLVSNHEIKAGIWYLYINLKDCSMGILAHELFHATHRILEYFGVEFTKDNHEPFAYLMEYLVDECYKLKTT